MKPVGSRPSSPRRSARSFLGGAYTLAGAAVISRALGAVYRVLLYGILKPEGMGLLQMAMPVYFLTVAVCTSGIRTATSRMVAEREAVHNRAEADAVFQTSLWLLSALGFALSILMFGLSRPVAKFLTKDPGSVVVIAAIAPGIFFEAVTAAYRGLFHGRQTMWPAAVSQVVEQAIRVITTFVLVFAMLPLGIEMAAAGAALGTVTGSAAGLLCVLWAHSSSRRTATSQRMAHGRSYSGSARILGEIARIAAPLSLVTGMLSVTHLIDVAVIPMRLQSLGMPFREATALYGRLAGGAMPLVTLPTVVTAALQVSLVPAVTSAQARRELPRIRRLVGTALRVSITLMLPAAVGLYVLSAEIPAFLYKDPEMAPVLAVMASVPLLLSLEQLTAGSLQGLGRFGVLMRNHLLAAGAQTVVTYYLTGLPAFGIVGAAYGTMVGMMVCAGLNFLALSAHIPGLLRDVRGAPLRPAVAALFMAGVIRYSYDAIMGATHLQSVALIAAVSLGALLYLLTVGGVGRLIGPIKD
ncbi:MAG: polysaccharide biosynthesis protein [Bacillota bacterium]|nr:polysaccharide biosynthesis protein [Bacillota bacterium]